MLKRFGSSQECSCREDGQAVTNGLQIFKTQQWCAPTFDHVGHQGQVKTAANLLHFFHRFGALHKQNVCTCFGVHLGTPQRLIQTQGGAGISAGNNEEIGV